jgi:hypothetical protein
MATRLIGTNVRTLNIQYCISLKEQEILRFGIFTFSISYPGPEQGYGRIQLDQALQFTSTGEFTLQVLGASNSTSGYYASFSSTGQVRLLLCRLTSQ